MSSTPQAAPVTLDGATQRFKAWRESTPRPRRVPAELWSLATECAQLYGVSPTARKLGVDYYALKRRVAPPAASAQAQPVPAFVELALDGGARPAGACVVELADGDGRRLRVEMSERAATEVVAIARALWEAGR